MLMRIYDTAKRSYCSFEPEHIVKIYVCGITPYDSAHLGHIFTFMTYDLLQRRLEDQGHEVQMVRNITDVDEPIYIKAAELKTDYVTLANKEIASFQTVLKQLNFRPIYAEPKASDYIFQMAEAVKILVDKAYGYYVDRDIYFDTAKFQRFGKFAKYNERLLYNLMDERGGNVTLNAKRHPLDFLLWKCVDDPADKAQWQTALGSGRPGWHIECSVMSSSILGNNFDLHGGGTDLIFPHHESEIAQSVTLNNIVPAKHWLHVSPMLLAGEKMSKSLGNMIFAKDLLKDHSSATIRLALMHYHHRMGGEWQSELLLEAEKLLEQLKSVSYICSDELAAILLEEVRSALDDDINTLEVIDALHRFIINVNKRSIKKSSVHPVLTKTLKLLGLVE
jgi:L-cysteine:1D-myo-inositol 2-amino-2-deoxy-alpha-D-glucopyranoside ligase